MLPKEDKDCAEALVPEYVLLFLHVPPPRYSVGYKSTPLYSGVARQFVGLLGWWGEV